MLYWSFLKPSRKHLTRVRIESERMDIWPGETRVWVVSFLLLSCNSVNKDLNVPKHGSNEQKIKVKIPQKHTVVFLFFLLYFICLTQPTCKLTFWLPPQTLKMWQCYYYCIDNYYSRPDSFVQITREDTKTITDVTIKEMGNFPEGVRFFCFFVFLISFVCFAVVGCCCFCVGVVVVLLPFTLI